jgi:hypothetical protein
MDRDSVGTCLQVYSDSGTFVPSRFDGEEKSGIHAEPYLVMYMPLVLAARAIAVV